MLRLALLPALWFALSGAMFVDPVSMQAALECQAELEPSLKLFETLQPVKIVDQSKPPDRDVIRFYDVPAGMSVFGMKPDIVSVTEEMTGGGRTVVFISVVSLPFDEVRNRVLAARGSTACQRSDANSCGLVVRSSETGMTGLLIKNRGSLVAIACGHAHEGS